MVQHAGRHVLGADQGRVALLTARDGLAAQAGHDLTIEITTWSGELALAEDGQPTELSVKLDLNSLVVREGTGGVKPLTDRDRREIAVTSRKVLGVERHPEATFTASGFEPNSSGGGFIQGTLTLGGISRPLKLHVAKTGPERYRATASVRQSEFGIKPYTAFLGALKVSDAVGVTIDIDLAKSDLANSNVAEAPAAENSAAGHSAGGPHG
jgi:polyisoprenoid-binding protein YceI